MQGTVLRYFPKGGYGFIAPQAGDREIFFHASALSPRDRGLLKLDGCDVTFEIGEFRGRPTAVNLRIVAFPPKGERQ